jgi:FkbM family methyltransferase
VYEAQFTCGTLRTLDPPFYSAEVIEQYERFHPVQQGETVIDAGAYHGMMSLYFALQVGPSGRVVAIEPDDGNRAAMENNLAQNPTLGNIEVEAALLWHQGGTVEFCQRGALGSSALWAPEGYAKVPKRAITLDDLVATRSLNRVDFVKIDAEGAEGNILRGAKETISRFRPAFSIAAYHVIDGKQTFGEVEALLQSLGYATETIRYGEECLTYGRPR